MHLLLIEDDAEAARFLAKGLRESGYVVDIAADGREGLFRATEGTYDLIVADRQLPHFDGLSIVAMLRKNGRHTPVLILSAPGSVDDRIEGLRAGGDDYLAKPFAFGELVARIEALLRRGNLPEVTTRIRIADLELDLLGRKVTRANTPIDVTLKYVPAGGRVEVRVQNMPDGVSLSVADNGPGIAAGERAAALRPFVRVGDAASKAAGSGLGLSLAAAVARHESP